MLARVQAKLAVPKNKLKDNKKIYSEKNSLMQIKKTKHAAEA